MPNPSDKKPISHAITLRSAVLCDVVRVEVTGKKIMIGCYDMGVVLHRRPTVFSGKIVGTFEVHRPGKHTVNYRMRAPAVEGQGGFETAEANEEEGFVPFEADVQTIVEEDGVILLDWQLDGGEWSRPLRWNLTFHPDALRLDEGAANELRSRYWGENWPEVQKAMKLSSADNR